MRYAHILLASVTALAGITCGGCGRQTGRIFYDAGRSPVVERTGPQLVALGPATEAPPPVRARSASEGQIAERPHLTSVQSGEPATQPAATPASQPAPYTSPRGNIRQLAFLAMLGAATPGPGRGSAAKEASEASLASAGSLTAGGVASLAAPQPRTLAAVVGQSGLQRGFAAGLGFSHKPNIFTPQANPLTGPNGRSQDLIRAGFFPNQAAVNKYFGK